MTRETLERELNTLGWELKIVREVNLNSASRYEDAAYAALPSEFVMFYRDMVRLGVLHLVLSTSLKTFRQRDVYRKLTGRIKVVNLRTTEGR